VRRTHDQVRVNVGMVSRSVKNYTLRGVLPYLANHGVFRTVASLLGYNS